MYILYLLGFFLLSSTSRAFRSFIFSRFFELSAASFAQERAQPPIIAKKATTIAQNIK